MTGIPLSPEDAQTTPAQQSLTQRVQVVVPPGARLSVTIEARDPSGAWAGERELVFAHPGSTPWGRYWARLRSLDQAAWAALLMSAALALYLAVRLIGLAQFPIYFFTDEAVQTMLAADLLRDNFRAYTGELLPTYFPNGEQYNLSLSVYLQVIPTLLFGRSIFLTRLIPVLVTLIAAWSVGRSLQAAFRSPYAWLGPLLLSLTPAWFLHSRTAFEVSLAVTFYALFLYAYLRYRTGSPKHLYLAVAAAALCFYSYSPAQVVMVVTAALLFISDLKYHWQQRKTLLRALGLGLLLALPYLRFQFLHPGQSLIHLQALRSYWVHDIPLSQKLATYARNYLDGLNPLYWHLPDQGMARHVMKGYGHLLRPALPLLVVGMGLALKQIKSSPQRVLLAAVMAAPSGAAVVEVGITRALFMVVPAVLLTALGLSAVLQAAEILLARWQPARITRLRLAGAVFVVLAAASAFMLRDALVNGPLWERDYGLEGMQWGASTLFPAVEEYRQANPDALLLVSPSWANGTDVVARFFSGDEQPYELGSIAGYINEYVPIEPNRVFVMIPSELNEARQSEKFSGLFIERTLVAPDGQPAFHFVRLRYADDAPIRFAQEEAARLRLSETQTVLDGQLVTVRCSALDMGEVQALFDGDPYTLIRTLEANPLQVVILFPEPRRVSEISLRVGGAPNLLTLRLFQPGSAAAIELSRETEEKEDPHAVTLVLGDAVWVERIEIDVLSVRDTVPTHVHLWEVELD